MAFPLSWFPFLAADWLADGKIRALNLAQKGVFVEMLALQWREDSLPADLSFLTKLVTNGFDLADPVGYPDVVGAVGSVADVFFPIGKDGRRRNKKLAELRSRAVKKYNVKAKAGRQGGIKSGLSRRSKIEAKRTDSDSESDTDTTSTSAPSGAVPTPTSTAARGDRRTRDRWLTPFSTAWFDRFGSEPDYGRLAKCLWKLVQIHSTPVVLAHFKTYLAEAKADFVNPGRFASTFRDWAPKQIARPSHLRYQTADEADRRAGIPLKGEQTP